MEKRSKGKFVVESNFVLQLYVSGMTTKSMEAIENIKKLCEEYLPGAYQLEIIDLYKHPEAAIENQIVFSPSLIKRLPLPRRTLIGTFSDTERVLKALEIAKE